MTGNNMDNFTDDASPKAGVPTGSGAVAPINFWDARRRFLQSQIRALVLDLFEHTGSAAFQMDLDPPHGKLLLLAGAPGEILRRLDDADTKACALLARAIGNNTWRPGDLEAARELLGAATPSSQVGTPAQAESPGDEVQKGKP